MQVFGWLLFVAGAIFLFLTGFVGSSGIANLPGVIFGMALLVSGSIFAAAGYVVEQLKPPVETVKTPTITQGAEVEKPKSRPTKTDIISLPPDFNRLLKEHEEKNLKGKTITIFEFDEGSFVVENSDGRWARYDTLEQAKNRSF